MRRRFRPVPATAETLAAVGVLGELAPGERATIAARCTAGLFPPGVEVIGLDDRSLDVYFVASGALRVSILSAGGKEITYRRIEAGGVFGDLAAIDGQPRSASVFTITECLLAWMPAAVFATVLRTQPAVAMALMRELVALIRALSERVLEFSTLGVNNRLHAELLRLAHESGGDTQRACIHPAPTHAELASRISTHREAVTREMSRLARAGIVHKRSGSLVIEDLRRLTAMVREVKAT